MCPIFLLKKKSLIDEADRQVGQKSAPRERVVLVKAVQISSLDMQKWLKKIVTKVLLLEHLFSLAISN